MAIPKVGQRGDIKPLTTWQWLAEPRELRGVINVVKSGQTATYIPGYGIKIMQRLKV
jgi:hypothetical protein